MIRIVLIIAFLFGIGPGPRKSGRRGNALMRQEQFADAANAYAEALATFDGAEPGALQSGLLNNLGAALYRQGDFDGALNAFDASAQLSPGVTGGSSSAYNAGGAAYRSEALEQALGRYREALLQDPTNQAARFNYEFVKRKMEQQEQEQDQDEDQDQDQQGQDQQDQDKDQEQEQDQDQQDQDQDQQQQDQEQQQDQSEQQQQQEPQDQLSQEEAERILEALQNEEEQLLRQVQKMKTRPRRVEKDW